MNVVKNWPDEWLLKLNIDKRKTVSYCLKHVIDINYHIGENNCLSPLEKVKSTVDFGVHFDSNLTFLGIIFQRK